MFRLRSKWGKRWVVAVLLASLLSASFATVVQTAQHTSSFVDWIRAQLRNPNDEAVARALEQAAASKARSLEAFLHVFFEAFEARRPDASPTSLFSSPSLSEDALIAYLQGRFLGIVGDAILPRVTLTAAQTAPGQTLERGAVLQAIPARRDRTLRARTGLLRPAARLFPVLAVRMLCAARPLGP